MLSKIAAHKVMRGSFKKGSVATMETLFHLLNTHSRMSVLRRLRELNYQSSYSHAGRYYTLPEHCHFDSAGLWFVENIGFSKFGNLKQTIAQLVELSGVGKTHQELEMQLKIRAHNTLLDLYRDKQITREKFNGVYIYLSHDPQTAADQLSKRLRTRSYCGHITPDWLVIEILAEVVRSNQMQVDHQRIAMQLQARDVTVTSSQVEDLLTQLDLKKTAAYRSSTNSGKHSTS